MATAQQIHANLANAQLSTGPRSPEGKRNSSQNSVRHSLTVTSIDRFPSAIRTEYRELHAKLKHELAPGSYSEDIIFESFVFSQFMYLRAQAAEASALDQHLTRPSDPQLLKNLERSTRYTRSHSSSATRALKQLEQLQANRLAVAELQALIGQPETSGIQVPIAFPCHLVLHPKHLKSNQPDLALRFVSQKRQNEPNSLTQPICE